MTHTFNLYKQNCYGAVLKYRGCCLNDNYIIFIDNNLIYNIDYFKFKKFVKSNTLIIEYL